MSALLLASLLRVAPGLYEARIELHRLELVAGCEEKVEEQEGEEMQRALARARGWREGGRP